MNELYFTRTHEWLHVQVEEVIIGITDHAQQLLGDLVFLELPEIGKSVTAGDELGVVESVKAASDFYAPVSGEISAINNEAINNPALVNTHPYSTGWLVKIKPSQLTEIDNLLSSDQYEKIVAEEQ